MLGVCNDVAALARWIRDDPLALPAVLAYTEQIDEASQVLNAAALRVRRDAA